MRFRSDDQRKAVMANMNKFAMRPMDRFVSDIVEETVYPPGPYAVEGYTGAKMDVAPVVTRGGSGEISMEIRPSVVTTEGSVVIPENTIILAGEGYKSAAFPKQVIDELVARGSVESGIPVEELREIVPAIETEAAEKADRYLKRRPVFSDAAQDLEAEAGKYVESIRRLEASGDPELLAAAQRSINKVSGDVERAVKDIKFAEKPKIVKMETPIGTLEAKPQFAEEMKTAKLIKPEPRDYLGELKAKGAVMKTFDPTK